MAENRISGNRGEGKFDWKADRIEMTRDVWANILDPIMTFAELVRGYDYEKGLDLTPQEISETLRLLVIGAYTEPKMYCTFGGSLRHVSGEQLEKEIRNWDGGDKEGAA